jgi:hypothetical protein
LRITKKLSLNSTTFYFRYNSAHRKTRVLIENTFGSWKRRFALLHQENRREIPNVCKDVAACAVLHNIAVENGLPDNFYDPYMNEDEFDFPYMEGDNANVFQTALINNFFNY